MSLRPLRSGGWLAAVVVMMVGAGVSAQFRASYPGDGRSGKIRSGGTAQASFVGPYTGGWYGDSIVQGACSSTAPPVKLDTLLAAGWTIFNLGVSGETAHQISARIISGASTACNGERCGVYIVEGGVNTLKAAGYTAAFSPTQVAGAALNGTGNGGVCETVVNESCGMLDAIDHLLVNFPEAEVVWMDVAPYSGCSGDPSCGVLVEPTARMEKYNEVWVAACATRPRVRCVATEVALEDPEAPGHLLDIYACDGIHLVQVGSDLLASLVQAVMP